MLRLYRRIIVRHFGSTRNFLIWIAAVVGTIYVIDTYLLTKDRLQAIVTGGEHDVKHMEKGLPEKHAEDDKNDKDGLHVPEPDKAKEPDDKKEPPKEPPPPAKPGKCGVKEECSKGKYAYYVKSGEGRDTSPTICFNGQ